MDQTELNEILTKHSLYLRSEGELGRHADLHEADLKGLDLRQANLRGVDLNKANLKDANLQEANLEDALLEGVNLEAANLTRALLKHASLKNVILDRANLRKANLHFADLYRTSLRAVDFRGADLKGARLSESILMDSDLRNADLTVVNFEDSSVIGNRYNSHTSYAGSSFKNRANDPLFERFLKDQNYINSVRKRNPWLHGLWSISSDCGRSLTRWCFWSLFFVFYFSLNFYFLGEDAFVVSHLKWKFSTMVYHSVVTFTTLGFGDIAPKTETASYWIMAEVVVGYLMLGGLISILADKLARRS